MDKALLESAILPEDLSEFKDYWNFVEIKQVGENRYVAILRFLYTYAIVTGSLNDRFSYNDRWCYHNLGDCKKAYNSWDGADGTEPKGWHRHPATGRRVDEHGNEYVNL